MAKQAREELDRRIDVIESGYEFMLAYAAQGLESDRNAGPEQNIRRYLSDMNGAMEGLHAVAVACAEQSDGPSIEDYRAFLDALEADARKAQAAVRLVLGRDAISSQLIDNLNASSHLRALLTDLFLIDEALKGKPGPE